MKHWAENIKPAAAVHVHLFTAWLMWSVVGVLLVTLGSWWVWQEPTAATPWLTAAAIGIGVLKSRYLLDRAAHRIVARIRTRMTVDVWAVFSPCVRGPWWY